MFRYFVLIHTADFIMSSAAQVSDVAHGPLGFAFGCLSK